MDYNIFVILKVYDLLLTYFKEEKSFSNVLPLSKNILSQIL
jgi:predicted CopG family antitoxin